MESYGNIDSKYRFVILASKRAKQLLKGAKPKLKAKSRNLIRIAQTEVRGGLIEYEIIPSQIEDVPEREERVFVGAEIGDDAGDADGPAGKDVAGEEADLEPGEDTEEGEGADEDEEGSDEELKDDKDE